jgi:hypothetical protein
MRPPVVVLFAKLIFYKKHASKIRTFGLPERFVLICPARSEAHGDVAWRFGELKTAQSRWSCGREEALVEELDSRRSTRRREFM